MVTSRKAAYWAGGGETGAKPTSVESALSVGITSGGSSSGGAGGATESPSWAGVDSAAGFATSDGALGVWTSSKGFDWGRRTGAGFATVAAGSRTAAWVFAIWVFAEEIAGRISRGPGAAGVVSGSTEVEAGIRRGSIGFNATGLSELAVPVESRAGAVDTGAGVMRGGSSGATGAVGIGAAAAGVRTGGAWVGAIGGGGATAGAAGGVIGIGMGTDMGSGSGTPGWTGAGMTGVAGFAGVSFDSDAF